MKPGAYEGIEFAPAVEAGKVQNRLLKEHVEYCALNSAYYREVFKEHPVSFRDVCVENIGALPFTRKSDIEAGNDDFLAVPASSIVDIVQSSGTTGEPTRVMYTENDLKRLAYNEKLSFSGCGITRDDVVLLTCTMDRCFIAGLAYFLGIRSIGAAAIRNGHGSMASHMDIIDRMKPTAIVGVPTFIRKLGIYMRRHGRNPALTGVKRLVCIGEPLRNRNMERLRLCRDLEEIWGAGAYSTYASSECITTFCECIAGQGGHLHTDLGIVEIVDESGGSVEEGVPGEIVITPLGIEGMPLIRFRTGDIGFVINEKCSCGRFSPRIGPVIGRKKQMMKVRGTTIYPQAIYSVLDEMDGISEYCISVDSQDDLADDVTVHVAVRDGGITPQVVGDALQARLRVKPMIALEEEEKLRQRIYSPESRKPVRFVDKREKSW